MRGWILARISMQFHLNMHFIYAANHLLKPLLAIQSIQSGWHWLVLLSLIPSDLSALYVHIALHYLHLLREIHLSNFVHS